MGVLALTAAMVLAAFLLLRTQSPSFGGKPLEVWLAEYNPGAGGGKSEQAAAAIQRAGASACPGLIQILGANTPAITSLKSRLRNWLPFMPVRSQVDLQWKAVSAFQILGPRASSAVPALSRLLERGRNPGYVSTALSRIGPDALPHLIMAMTNRDALVRFASIHAVGRMGTNALPAVPEIQKALQDPVPTVVTAAADALKELGAGRFSPENANLERY